MAPRHGPQSKTLALRTTPSKTASRVFSCSARTISTFRNKQADKLIEELRGTLDKPERIRLLREFHHILHDEQPYSFLFLPQFAYCHRRGLEGIVYAKVRPVVNLLPWWNSRSDS